jgi:hypothetical protein
LTCAAALGAVAFGHVQLSVTSSLVLGGVPGVLVGSLVSSRAPDRLIRPVITFVILASGLKYVGIGTVELGWTLCALLLVGAGVWLSRSRLAETPSSGRPEADTGQASGARSSPSRG